MSAFAPSLFSAMNIKDFLSPTDVMFDVAVPNKQKLLFELANKAGWRLRLSPHEVFAELCKREELGSTGIGAGIALPHARFHQVNKPFGLFLRLRQPIEFDALDGNPVDIVFLLLLPEGNSRSRLFTIHQAGADPVPNAMMRTTNRTVAREVR
jgi:nitrogen PTS system EIIA component